MKKRFIAKKRVKGSVFKILLSLIILYFSSVVTFNLLLQNRLKKTFEDMNTYTDLFDFGTNQKEIINFDLLNPKDMLKIGLNYDINVKPIPTYDELELVDNHTNDSNPLIYIYNTHDTENYDSSLFESYNINYNVKIASYILSDHLGNLGIPSYVEEESMADYLNKNGLTYNNSYDASRYYLKKRMEEYPSIKYMIDLHRDSVSRGATSVSIDGKSYAKVLFVVGLDNKNYEPNLKLAKEINNRLDEKLRRGILEKETVQKKSFYNQDVDGNIALLEIGGVDNTIEEVNNTLEVIAKIYFDLLNE